MFRPDTYYFRSVYLLSISVQNDYLKTLLTRRKIPKNHTLFFEILHRGRTQQHNNKIAVTIKIGDTLYIM